MQSKISCRGSTPIQSAPRGAWPPTSLHNQNSSHPFAIIHVTPTMAPDPDPSSSYGYKPGGSLKFKGQSESETGKKHKKKKKSSTSTSSSSSFKEQIAREALRQEEREHGADKERSGSSGRKMTDAELRFEEVQRRRVSVVSCRRWMGLCAILIMPSSFMPFPSQRQEKIRKEASKTHKEKVSEFNRYLENLSEHHDIPKVGPG